MENKTKVFLYNCNGGSHNGETRFFNRSAEAAQAKEGKLNDEINEALKHPDKEATVTRLVNEWCKQFGVQVFLTVVDAENAFEPHQLIYSRSTADCPGCMIEAALHPECME